MALLGVDLGTRRIYLIPLMSDKVRPQCPLLILSHKLFISGRAGDKHKISKHELTTSGMFKL